MNRRSFIFGVASSPILSSLPVVDIQDDSDKEIDAFKAQYTDSGNKISYWYDDGTKSTDIYDSREDWFDDVITESPRFSEGPTRPMCLCDSTLHMISLQEDYCYGFHKSGDYQIHLHTGLEDHDLFFVECYTDIREDIDRFDADSYEQLVIKLDERNAIFR